MKVNKTIPKTFVIELTENEIYELVHRLKFIREEHRVSPDLTRPIWTKLEELLPQAVTHRVDLY